MNIATYSSLSRCYLPLTLFLTATLASFLSIELNLINRAVMLPSFHST